LKIVWNYGGKAEFERCKFVSNKKFDLLSVGDVVQTVFLHPVHESALSQFLYKTFEAKRSTISVNFDASDILTKREIKAVHAKLNSIPEKLFTDRNRSTS
jgi:hypothetical protein